jgi:hypothetical protein
MQTMSFGPDYNERERKHIFGIPVGLPNSAGERAADDAEYFYQQRKAAQNFRLPEPPPPLPSYDTPRQGSWMGSLQVPRDIIPRQPEPAIPPIIEQPEISKIVSWFYYILMICFLALGGVFLAAHKQEFPFAIMVFLLPALTFCAVGWGLHEPVQSLRTLAGCLCAGGLLVFPMGTALNGLVLYSLYLQQSKVMPAKFFRSGKRSPGDERKMLVKALWISFACFLVEVVLLLGALILWYNPQSDIWD